MHVIDCSKAFHAVYGDLLMTTHANGFDMIAVRLIETRLFSRVHRVKVNESCSSDKTSV